TWALPISGGIAWRTHFQRIGVTACRLADGYSKRCSCTPCTIRCSHWRAIKQPTTLQITIRHDTLQSSIFTHTQIGFANDIDIRAFTHHYIDWTLCHTTIAAIVLVE